MGFLKPNIPKMTAAPPPPTPDNSQELLAKAAQEERLRRQTTGRASTILTSPTGLLSQPDSASKALLGQ
jgi:hypothetical protein